MFRSAVGHTFTETFLQSVGQVAAVLGTTAAVFNVYFTTLSYYFNLEYEFLALINPGQFLQLLSGHLSANWDLAVQTLGRGRMIFFILASKIVFVCWDSGSAAGDSLAQ